MVRNTGPLPSRGVHASLVVPSHRVAHASLPSPSVASCGGRCRGNRNKLFTVSCLRLGYDPKRWTVVRKQRIGDLYEAMYQADLKVCTRRNNTRRGAVRHERLHRCVVGNAYRGGVRPWCCQEDPLFEASTRGALVYQSTRHEEELRDKFGSVTDPGDVRRKRAMDAVLHRNTATGKLDQEHVRCGR